jgi:hypothetical protein
MADRSRVPTPSQDFNAYINRTDKFLQAIDTDTALPNWQRLDLKAAEAGWWNSQRVFWSDTLYPKHTNKTTKTIVTTADIKDFKAQFKKMSARMLDTIAAADATGNKEALIFNLVAKGSRKKPVYHTTSISDGIALLVQVKGGGRLHFSCRTGHDINRASLAKMSNCVQVAYSIGEKVDADHMAHHIISTRASFIHEFGSANIGKWVYIHVRWYHTKHPQLAGVWSEMTRVMIA